MEIFIARAEQGLDVRTKFNIFFHSELWRRLQQPDWAHSLLPASDVDFWDRLHRNFLRANSWVGKWN
jgi:hypothetical protein